MNINELLSVSDAVPDSKSSDYTKQIVILSPEKLKSEHRTAVNQLWEATHGPGCTEKSFTGTVHLKHIIDGDTMAVHRSEILGIAKDDVVQKYSEEPEQAQAMQMGGISQ